VRWPVRLARQPGELPIATCTNNISSSGFYCYSPESFSPGEMLSCSIDIPAWTPGAADEHLTLECRVQVIWVERVEAIRQFGIGCHIHDYVVTKQVRERMSTVQ